MPLTLEEMEVLTDKCVQVATRAWTKRYLAGNGESIGRLAAKILAHYLEKGVSAKDIGDLTPLPK